VWVIEKPVRVIEKRASKRCRFQDTTLEGVNLENHTGLFALAPTNSSYADSRYQHSPEQTDARCMSS
jgi:hypothetical protein